MLVSVGSAFVTAFLFLGNPSLSLYVDGGAMVQSVLQSRLAS